MVKFLEFSPIDALSVFPYACILCSTELTFFAIILVGDNECSIRVFDYKVIVVLESINAFECSIVLT